MQRFTEGKGHGVPRNLAGWTAPDGNRASSRTPRPARTDIAAETPLRVTTLTLDPPGPNELLLRIDAAGLCHSDLSVINGDRPRPMPMAAVTYQIRETPSRLIDRPCQSGACQGGLCLETSRVQRV